MSSESFQAFVQKVTDDPGLREQLRAAGGDDGLSLQALAEFAKHHGFEFAASDVTGELSDAQLGGVAGGILIGLNQSLTMYKLSPTLSVTSDYLVKLTNV